MLSTDKRMGFPTAAIILKGHRTHELSFITMVHKEFTASRFTFAVPDMTLGACEAHVKTLFKRFQNTVTAERYMRTTIMAETAQSLRALIESVFDPPASAFVSINVDEILDTAFGQFEYSILITLPDCEGVDVCGPLLIVKLYEGMFGSIKDRWAFDANNISVRVFGTIDGAAVQDTRQDEDELRSQQRVMQWEELQNFMDYQGWQRTHWLQQEIDRQALR